MERGEDAYGMPSTTISTADTGGARGRTAATLPTPCSEKLPLLSLEPPRKPSRVTLEQAQAQFRQHKAQAFGS